MNHYLFFQVQRNHPDGVAGREILPEPQLPVAAQHGGDPGEHAAKQRGAQPGLGGGNSRPQARAVQHRQ